MVLRCSDGRWQMIDAKLPQPRKESFTALAAEDFIDQLLSLCRSQPRYSEENNAGEVGVIPLRNRPPGGNRFVRCSPLNVLHIQCLRSFTSLRIMTSEAELRV